MNESAEPDIARAELADRQLNWAVTPEDIRNMSREELAEQLVDFNEKIRRLYEVVMLQVHSVQTGEKVDTKDIDSILNPEKY